MEKTAYRKIILHGSIALAAIVCTMLQLAPAASRAQSAAPLSPEAQAAFATAFAGDVSCAECHQDKTVSYLGTVHHRTTRLPTAHTIAGHFSAQENEMTTLNPQLAFKMEQRDGRFYESAIRNRGGHKTTHTETIDLVVGSATKGQTYLYWQGDHLFELPVSYWTELDRWVNSPGYVDGSADFDRPVTARCLECHTTFFEGLPSAGQSNRFRKDNFVLGISCERCHGPGLTHVQEHRAAQNTGASRPMPPAGLARDRQIDICAQCHGGVGQSLAPAFSFRPGDDLSTKLLLPRPVDEDVADVHGNQALLLKRSRCFLASPDLSCSTCHDVHAPERPAASYSVVCLRCHQQEKCGMFARIGAKVAANCVDCHMPIQESKQLVLDMEETRLKAKVRNHRIGIYPGSGAQ